MFNGQSISQAKLAAYAVREGIVWPRTPTGLLTTKTKAFKALATRYPQLEPLRQVSKTLGQMRQIGFEVGADGRNRTNLKPFQQVTGRNSPSGREFLLAGPKWARSLIKPPWGRAVIYADWSQQELAIAAWLSGDPAMQAAVVSGDFYLAFAKQAGAVPKDGTRADFERERKQYKQCALGVLYGIGPRTLAQRIGSSVPAARRLIFDHKRTYSVFWGWMERVKNQAAIEQQQYSSLGWKRHVDGQTRGSQIMNFPMQANGADMLRVAAVLADARGLELCALLHDALLAEASVDEAGKVARALTSAMEDAAAVVCGHPIGVDVEIFKYPERYIHEDGIEMWNLVNDQLAGAVANMERGLDIG